MLQTTQIKTKPVTIDQINFSSSHLADSNIILRIQAGDINAYGDIIKRYNQRMFRIARSIVTNDATAMDIVQEAHIKAYTKLNEFRGPGQFFSWLASITRNEAFIYLRKHKREVSMTDDIIQLFENEENNQKIDSQQNNKQNLPDSSLENAQFQKIINQHIDKLPEDFRIVFVLRAIEQLNVKETAEILSIKEQTVKTRYFRAKRMLRNHIQNTLNIAGMRVYEFGNHHCDIVFSNVMAFINHSK